MKAFNKIWLLAPLAILGAACGKTAPEDTALKNDLALASQAQAFIPPQVMSPAEQGYAVNPYTTPQRQVVSRAPARTSTVRRTSSTRSSGVVYREPAPQPTRVIKHTKRDAAIGAAAGAIIGATTSRDKLKGGLIGAAAGAIIGGVIGNNVDVKRVPY
ncbi:MAG TPA: YMGG-like glycine zipper-containing protein [Gemmatimonadaceae bacterium]|nr:YMGG-like glycine zipper-containing protein [Gemmatimonadaceae bacterium]